MSRFLTCRPLTLLLLLLLAGTTGSAQSTRSVSGRVRRPVAAGGDSTGMGPASGAWVTLHRVGKDKAGPIDSVRSDATGRYRFSYQPTGSADAVYFASTTWGGIAYFTAPLRAQQASGDDAEITVFDTTSRSFPLAIKGRHLIVSKADSSDMRTVVEVYELSNDSLRTLVSVDSVAPKPTWSATVPAAARDVRVNEGEISPDAFVASQGQVSVYAPIAPGLKQVAFSYKLPSSSFPLALTSSTNAVVFEVLLEDAQGTVTGKGFAAVDPVTLERRNFRRFLAQDLPAETQLILDVPSSGTPGRNMYIAGLLVAIGFLMLLMLTRSMQRAAQRRSAVSTGPSVVEVQIPLPDRLAQEISALDAIYARQDNPSEAVQRAYELRRAELREALAQALAGADTGR